MFGRIILVILIFLLGLIGGYIAKDNLPFNLPFANAPISKEKPKEKGERKPLFYRNPMNPAITSPVPAKDEMGMDYIPVYPEDLEGGSSKSPGTVTIDPVTMQNIGVRTEKVKCMPLSRTITTYGTIVPDEDTLYMVHAKFKGWVEDLRVKETGEYVRKGEVLLYVYSPEVLTAQDELLMALHNLEAVSQGEAALGLKEQAQTLVDASTRRLALLGVPEWFIEEVKREKKSRRLVPVESPGAGIVMKINVRPKSYITPKTTLYAISDLRSVWVMAAFFEDELPWIHVGDNVELKIRGMPGKIIKGKIDFVYPTVDQKTRTIRARIRLKNPELTLRPGMYVTVTMRAARKEEVLVVPAPAVLRTGRQEHVFVALGDGKFEPRPVTLGVEADGLFEVKSGLRLGEEVVVSGQFLIDSESSLREAAIKMMEPKGPEKNQKKNMPPGMKMPKKGGSSHNATSRQQGLK